MKSIIMTKLATKHSSVTALIISSGYSSLILICDCGVATAMAASSPGISCTAFPLSSHPPPAVMQPWRQRRFGKNKLLFLRNVLTHTYQLTYTHAYTHVRNVHPALWFALRCKSAACHSGGISVHRFLHVQVCVSGGCSHSKCLFSPQPHYSPFAHASNVRLSAVPDRNLFSSANIPEAFAAKLGGMCLQTVSRASCGSSLLPPLALLSFRRTFFIVNCISHHAPHSLLRPSQTPLTS